MKKTILVLFLILFSLSLSAQIFDESDTISDRAKKAAQDLAGCEQGTITNSTKLADVPREELDIGIRFSILDKPESGEYAGFAVGNFDVFAAMNFNRVLYGYAWYGERDVVHDKAIGSATEPEWKFKYYGFGLGFYFTPVFKFFGGAGNVIEAKNEGEVPSYGALYEYGVGYDYHINNYKIELAYRMVNVPIDTDEVPAAEWPARASFQTFSVGITAPFSLW